VRLAGTRMGRSLIIGTCAVLVAAIFAGACKRASVQSGTTWTTVWVEKFPGAAGQPLGSRYWEYVTGSRGHSNGEVETMTDSPANVHLDGAGDLDITALKQDGSWTSARIQTTSLYGTPAGKETKVAALIRQPGPASGLGYWPAFWLLGPGQWPEDGEIDIMEDVDAASMVAGTLHCGNLSAANTDGTLGPCHEHKGLSSKLRQCPGCQAGYNIYSVIIDRRDPGNEQVTWYLDNRRFFAVSERQVGTAVWTRAVDHGFTIILDLAVGGFYPDTRCGCITPTGRTSSGGTMSIRYVGVYERS